ncbi:hypothetical protein K491DRAFT_674865 [Lophiostoma macrostomum CBS 122681]|uniref:AA1-like domain-containing protein n=1 Tax=Lophiostoma macrostomum CBS 122681 TaxID=1314788 RepID=A0A6A6TKH1_9PLEO|nr:hypothetical protein K491DRAFT_674865 [Lophiostoma macrostomum CBS 122681]
MKILSIFSIVLAAVTSVTAAPVDVDVLQLTSTTSSDLVAGSGHCSMHLVWTEFCEGGYLKHKVRVSNYKDASGRVITEPGERQVGPNTHTRLWAIQGGQHEFWLDCVNDPVAGIVLTFSWMSYHWQTNMANRTPVSCGIAKNFVSKLGR